MRESLIPDGVLLLTAVKDGVTRDSVRDLEADHKISHGKKERTF